MSPEEVKKVLESSYKRIQTKDNNIIGYHISTGRLINANFCKGELVQVQKDLNATFQAFVKLVDQKTKEVGEPLTAWTRPATVESP